MKTEEKQKKNKNCLKKMKYPSQKHFKKYPTTQSQTRLPSPSTSQLSTSHVMNFLYVSF